MQLQQILENNNEKVRLVAYLIIMVVLARPLSRFLGVTWEERANVANQLIFALDPLFGITVEQTSALLFGIYLGLVLLLLLDPKKRIQGLLLGVGTGVGLVALLSLGLFLPNIDLVGQLPLIIGGIVFGGLLGGGRDLLELQAAEALEFRRAATILFLLLSGIMIIALIEYHVIFPEIISVDFASDSVSFGASGGSGISFEPDSILTNTVLTGIFIVTLRKFFKYDSSEEFFILGPVGSGKSLFLVGKYLAALGEITSRGDDTPMTPSSDLMELVNELDSSSDDAGWEIDSTQIDSIKNLEFTYVKGRIFPKNIRIGTLDYAGEYLDELPEALISSPDEIDSSILRQLSNRVKTADTIMLVIDMERHKRNDSLETESYFEILDSTDSANVLLIATKCDILAEEFQDDTGLDPVNYYDEFKEYVNDELTRNDQTIKSLVQNTAGSEIHPVYYQTTVKDDERVPMRDSNGNVQTMGFRRLLKKMG